MAKEQAENVQVFSRDVLEHGGYQYTTNAPLSSRLAHKRISDAVHTALSFQGKRVVDVGCGDGTYIIELYDRSQPGCTTGFDLAADAVYLARQKAGNRGVTFSVASAYELPYPPESFDIAHVRAVLHHMDQPLQALRESLRVASLVIVAEPNGNNPGVKLFERFSRYHREHNEKSYTSFQINRWLENAGGEIIYKKWIGLVPTFCPDWAARIAKFLEPLLERIPLLNMVGCSIYIVVARKKQELVSVK